MPSSIQLSLFDLPEVIRATRRRCSPKGKQADRDSYGRIAAKDEPVDQATLAEAEKRKQLSVANTLRLQSEKILELTQKLKDNGII